MGGVLNVKNFNAYTGRYSRKKRARSVERETGWKVYDLFAQIVPVLALRALGDERSWPLCWRNDRHLSRGVDLTLNSLKSWQAFRPFPPGTVIRKMRRALPGIVSRFQRVMLSREVKGLWRLGKQEDEVIVRISGAVQEVSNFKNPVSPMFGSKVLHFFFPELFPVWDTEWIKRRCLAHESLITSETIRGALWEQPAALEYSAYLSLLVRDLTVTTRTDYNRLKNICLHYSSGHGDTPHSRRWDEVAKWYFADLAPILFEICLLGKHCSR